MNPWTAAVEAIASALTSVGDWLGGGRAVGIVAAAFVIRAAMIPLLAPLAARTRDRQRIVRRIRPQIKALDEELKDDPSTLHKRLKELHEANGIKMVDWPGLGGALIQLPILIALFQAVLIIWEPQALTLGATGLGAVAGGLSLVGVKVTGQSEGAPWMLWMSALLPVAICLWLGAGVGFYLIGFYGAGAVQGFFMPHPQPTESPTEP